MDAAFIVKDSQIFADAWARRAGQEEALRAEKKGVPTESLLFKNRSSFESRRPSFIIYSTPLLTHPRL
jgi:hypothetical protein